MFPQSQLNIEDKSLQYLKIFVYILLPLTSSLCFGTDAFPFSAYYRIQQVSFGFLRGRQAADICPVLAKQGRFLIPLLALIVPLLPQYVEIR